jgi:hypothetical protein
VTDVAIVGPLPNESSDMILALLDIPELLKLRGLNENFRDYIHRSLHTARIWTATCNDTVQVVLKCEGKLATPLSTAPGVHNYVHLYKIHRIIFILNIQSGARPRYQSVTKLRKWLRKLPALIYLKVILDLTCIKSCDNAWLEEAISGALQGLKVDFPFRAAFRLGARHASLESHRRGMDVEKGICNRDSLDRWLRCQESEIRLRSTCVKERRTSARQQLARLRT